MTKVANVILYMLHKQVKHLSDKKVAIMLFLMDYNHLKFCEKKIFNEIIAKKEKMGQFIVINKIDGLWNKGDVENEDDGYKNEIKDRIEEVSKSFNIKEFFGKVFQSLCLVNLPTCIIGTVNNVIFIGLPS